MSIIRIMSGSFCDAEDVVQRLAQELSYEVVDDQAVVRETASSFEDQENKLWRTLAGKVSAFEKFTHEREISVGHLKMTLSKVLERDNVIIWGSAGYLIPRTISHVLSVCLIAEVDFRVQVAVRQKGISQKEARKLISKDDEAPKLWAEYLFKKSPWDADLFDIVLPMNKTPLEEAVRLISEHATSAVVQPTALSRQAVRDFQLAAAVEVALGKEGHQVLVSAKEGVVTLTINKQTLMLSRLEEELTRIVEKVPGVIEVKTKVGPEFHQSDIYRRFDLEVPSRVLLVDDEREFVQTLSERLLMRDVGTAVVYDGEQALSFVEEEVPDVVVLDLMMPGINGIEVLRRLKVDHPEVEVIILTGHGTERDKQLCLELGAFAYLQKPVDIEKLSKTMQEAYQQLRYKKAQ